MALNLGTKGMPNKNEAIRALNNWGMPICKLQTQTQWPFLFQKIKKNLRFHQCYIIFGNSSFMWSIKAKGYTHKNSWNAIVKQLTKMFIEIMDQNKFTGNICYLHAPFCCILALEPHLGHLQMLSQQWPFTQTQMVG